MAPLTERQIYVQAIFNLVKIVPEEGMGISRPSTC